MAIFRLLLAIALGIYPVLTQASTTWNTGDVFVAVSGGSYQVRDNSGTLKETISDGLGGFTTGCSFNTAKDKLYTTNFSATKVVVYDDASPHSVIQVVDTAVTSPGGQSESVVFDAAGNFYVGHPDGNDLIHKYDSAGTLLATYAVAVDNRGTDWIDIAVDQTTLYYTSEGRAIQRFDTTTNTQLPDFSALPGGGNAFALRLLPPGDGSGGLLVADNGDIKRLDGSGAVAQSYDVAGEDCWFALNLDPNGTSFWSASFCSSNLYRFNIATGAVEVGPINSGTGPSTVFGICLKGELTVAIPPEDCGNGVDDDKDGLVDNDDPDCQICGDGDVDPGEQCDDGNTTDDDGCSATCQLENEAPECSGAFADPSVLWPPNHAMIPISIGGVSDPDGDEVAITATSVYQDELVQENGQGSGNTSPDANLDPLMVRAERNGNPKTPGDGRVYHISFTADDGMGGTCQGEVTVCVPHDQRSKPGTCVDGGPLYNSIP